jgi:hypothetical protein
MDEHLFVDPTDGMACHVFYVPGPYPWTVRLIDTDSDQIVTVCRYPNIDLAHAFVRSCLPNLGDLS